MHLIDKPYLLNGDEFWGIILVRMPWSANQRAASQSISAGAGAFRSFSWIPNINQVISIQNSSLLVRFLFLFFRPFLKKWSEITQNQAVKKKIAATACPLQSKSMPSKFRQLILCFPSNPAGRFLKNRKSFFAAQFVCFVPWNFHTRIGALCARTSRADQIKWNKKAQIFWELLSSFFRS